MNVRHDKVNYYYILKVTGLVQGVGFRPFIYRLANEFGYKGWVENRNDGVIIKIESKTNTIETFRKRIIENAPAAASIESIMTETGSEENFDNFIIKRSETFSSRITEVSPDIAICPECICDMKSQPHRYEYPFINCTNCGPRFSIIRDLPYDRHNTTMDNFKMCKTCSDEYNDISDRRFHAQPVACNTCGPHYTLHLKNKITSDLNQIFNKLKQGLASGAIYAVKGIGGYHLMCDALNSRAVGRLRTIKNRDSKPFAVMFRSVDAAKDYANIDDDEAKELMSWRRPVVILDKIKELAGAVTNGIDTLGIMMPYMPFHFLLFEHINTPAIVLTSGNLSDEPIIISDSSALEQYRDKTDGVISYNREIFNRTDDSVLRVINKSPRIIRRSRGYAPSPIRTIFNAEAIFGSGAELVNSFCIGKDNMAILSQYMGDLKNFETYQFFRETFGRFANLFRFKPLLIVCDLHPDYLSTRFAEDLHDSNPDSKIIKVQHHHAHIASCMAENNLNKKVIGISFDGTGLGNDGNIWGAEVLAADYSGFERLFHFDYIPLPGGDKAIEEPWRMAISYLYHTYGEEFINLPLPMLTNSEYNEIFSIKNLIDNNINCPLASSAGRLFDAVSAMLQIVRKVTFHAEAPMKLESAAAKNIKERYGFDIFNEIITFKSLIRSIVEDIIKRMPVAIISAKFHNTIVELIKEVAKKSRDTTGLNSVILTGGTFQNLQISREAELLLISEGFEVFSQRLVPVNDQGIALGQLAIGAFRREYGII